MAGLVTRRPVTPEMVLAGARKLWDEDRVEEGRIEWDDAADYVRWPYIRRAQMVLEAALPQHAKALRELAVEFERVAAIL